MVAARLEGCYNSACKKKRFVLVDYDSFEISNINRQAGSYIDTVGRKKVDVLKEEIERINPEAQVSAISKRVPVDGLKDLLKGVLVASADDFAYSVVATRMAKKLSIPSVIGIPCGSLVRVWTNTDVSPDIENYFALPKNEPDYKTLYEALYSAKGRLNYARWAQRWCDWSAEWATGYAEGRLSLAQIAPVVWLTSSIVALEVIKCLTHRWIVFPKHWKITPASASIEEPKPHQ